MKKKSFSKIHAEILKKCKGKSLSKIYALLCGEMIGSGAHRQVFVFKYDPAYVVKIEGRPTDGAF